MTTTDSVGGAGADGGAPVALRRDERYPDRVFTDGPYEERFGYARAVRSGDAVLVSGCTAKRGAVVQHEGDPYRQTTSAFRVALAAIGEFGLDASHVARTRMYITHAGDADEVGRAHRDLFGEVRPAATMVVVAALIDSRMLVEVELDARR